MAIDFQEKTLKEIVTLLEYIKHFNNHYSLLLLRYARFKELNKTYTDDIDIITYLDIIVVQLRAMCIENPKYKNNYTVQILLKKMGEDGLAQRIDSMLDEEFSDAMDNITIRKALKILADGFICHYDNFDGEEKANWAIASFIQAQLTNPYVKCNLDYIMETVMDCIGEGLTVQSRS